MTRKTLEMHLQELRAALRELGDLVIRAAQDAMDALKRRDLAAARQVYENDQVINAKRYAIEQQALITIATQQPMAHDLRFLASVLDIAGELERMGDYAKGIAKITLLLGDQPLIKPLIDLPRMTELATGMLQRALTAFLEGDVETARRIPREDDMVDQLYNQIYRELIAIMLQRPQTIDQANFLIWAAHNIERFADRVTNICERTIFTVTGEMVELDVSDDALFDIG
ncbi:MAG: phosphate signaling complex protein PhoU [Chloroflexi bacterium]|nr:phosphate signaling complex protein PhoU [Chloroflexota bacterium]